MAGQYPTYTVAGVAMDDPSGRWELVPGTSLLPAFPGFRVNNYAVPGQAGNRSAAYAPTEASNFTVRVRFNAVADFAHEIVSGAEKRVMAIRDNINLFMQATAVARSGFHGLVEVRRYNSLKDYVVTSARLVSSSEPSFDPYTDYAVMTLIFENPAGVWRSPKADVYTATIAGGQVYRLNVPTGTAACINSFIAIRGPQNSKDGQRITVSNENVVGFKVGMAGKPLVIPSDRWGVINTLNWTYGSAHPVGGRAGAAGIPWECAKPDAGYLEPMGRPVGTALAILPSAQSGLGRVNISLPSSATIAIRSTRTWY